MLDHRSHRRTFGVFYTPAFVAELMAELSLPRFEEDGIRILDPACGDGALLAAVLMQRTRTASIAESRDVVGDRIFGVDIDPVSVERTKQRLFEMVAPPVHQADELRRILDAQIVCGDALTGPGFADRCDDSTGLDWREAFPNIAAHGGFDLIIANPPYRRERDSKTMFDRLAATPLGKHWRTPRMDLWHYFFHRSLDLLKPGGRLCFLVNSYWTKSPGARPLIDRMQQETSLEEIVEFDALPIFEDVGGRHMVLQLQKTTFSRRPCRLTRMMTIDGRLKTQHRLSLDTNEMFRDGQLILQPPAAIENNAATRLGDRYLVRQGIAENPPAINAKLAREFPGEYRVGEGVFVLTEDEAASLNWSADERRLLRPYAEPVEIKRYDSPRTPSRYLLYLTPRTAPELTPCPQIARHLARFRPILERRREVQKGSIAWWHLHWPRDERLFTQPRILHVQMSRQPTFAYTEQPLFVGFSMNVVAADVAHESREANIPLPALTAILNSALAAEWFDVYAKRRGVNLEISGTVLKQFPLPPLDAPLIARLNQLSHHLHAKEVRDMSIEVEIDNIVRRLYEV